jgi:Mg/Co/Ni transporter MgtE
MKRQQEGVLSRITDPKLHDSINKQIKNIDNLKNELKTTSSLDALDDLDELWNSLRKFTKAKVPPLNVIDVFTDMHTLNKANIFDDVDILKKLDFTKLSDLAKEAKYAPIKQQLDNIADAFMHFHSQNLKLIARNADLAHPLKTLIKFLAKAT